MECFRCKSRDFDVVKSNVLGHAYIECYKCRQGYLVFDKLQIKPFEITGNPDAGMAVFLACDSCDTTRMVAKSGCDTGARSVHKCNRCLEEETKSGSVTVPVGEKVSWSEFLNKDTPN